MTADTTVQTERKRRAQRKPDKPQSRLAAAVPSILAFATVVLGIVDIISAVTPEQTARLHALTQVVPLPVAHAASAVTVGVGLLLTMLGHGLRRRKRRAFRAAVALLLLSTVLHVVKGLDVEEAVTTAVLAALLLASSAQFYALGDPRTRKRAPLAFIALFAASVAIGLGLLYARDESVVGQAPFGARLREVLWGLIGVGGPLHFRTEHDGDLVFAVLLTLGVLTVVVTAYLALRPAEPVARLTPDDESRLRTLLGRHGHRDSLGYFALRRDKSVVFSPSGKAAISYRVVSGVMLASGDPIGDPEAWPGAIEEFMEVARLHAWTPAVMGCSELGGEVWVREADLRALELGDEAIVEVADFSLEGRAMRNVRQMVARVERAGYTTDVRRVRDISPEDVAEIQRQAAAWRDTEVERGFSMALGRFGGPEDADCVAITACIEGRVAAVLHFVPWGDDGLSLELMRRDRSADPGLNELMIVAALRAAPSLGVKKVSLNFAVFRSALERGGRLGAGPIIRAWRELLLVASRWFQIESLYRFNAKFRPLWEPRFVCYPGPADLPRVALAALEAEAFIVWPRWPSRRG
ncbi:MAG TPA: phosphatidylglycerol lysyltransferase domain-containing protein [Mycobacteriales bacterium]|nr:phosphatidylglycerol lysyltransferase domain-containing protein [Mycobacteriales bacterium]